jgi:hypothetical protein
MPTVVNHVVLCLANGCESWRIMCQWLWIMLCYAEPIVGNHELNVVPVDVNHVVLCCTSAVVLCWASRLESWCEPVSVGVNHGELCWSSGYESWCVMLYKWSWILERYAQPVVVIHVVLYLANGCESCCASGYESCCAMLNQSLEITNWTLCQWMWIMLCYAKSVVVNHCELCWASGCETLWAMPRYWLWIIVRYAEPVVVNHCVLCWAGYVRIMVCYAEPVVGNHGVNAVPMGVNHCVMLSQWLWIIVILFQ